MYSMGIAMLTCPFISHGKERSTKLQENVLLSPLRLKIISGDARKMSMYIKDSFRVAEVKNDRKNVFAALASKQRVARK